MGFAAVGVVDLPSSSPILVLFFLVKLEYIFMQCYVSFVVSSTISSQAKSLESLPSIWSITNGICFQILLIVSLSGTCANLESPNANLESHCLILQKDFELM
jgi:hypothetical protein